MLLNLQGAKPVFVDSNLEDGNVDIEKIEKKINNKTKAICIVHFFGFPVEMDKLKE